MRPFVLTQQERDGVHQPGPFFALRISVYVVRDSIGLNELLAGSPVAGELAGAHAPKRDRELPPVTAREAGGQQGFVPVTFMRDVLPQHPVYSGGRRCWFYLSAFEQVGLSL